MSKFGIDWTASDETSGERDAGHLLSCLEFAWNCLASHGLLEQAQQLAERIDSKRCARLSQAGAGGGVVVRALEWSEVSPPVQGLCSYTHTRAETPFGFYSIEWKGWKDRDPRTVFFHADGSNVIANENDLDEAKAAAQADYEARIKSALAPSPSAGEPVAWVIPGDDNARDDGSIDAMAWREGEFTRPLYATPPAPVQPTASVEAVLNLYREAVRIDAKMEGPQFMGANSSALKRAWEADRASLTPAPTQGDGERCTYCGDTGTITDRVDGEITCPECGYPSPSPVSAPSPAGGVREALARRLYKTYMLTTNRGSERIDLSGVDWDEWFDTNAGMPLSGPPFVALWNAMADAALSSPATPEPVSAPANGEVVDQAEINRIRDWLLERNHDHLLAAQENRITMMRVRSDTEMFLDAAILLSHLAALSNPAPGHGEAVPVVEPWLCGGCGQTDPAKRCLGCLHGLPPPHRR